MGETLLLFPGSVTQDHLRVGELTSVPTVPSCSTTANPATQLVALQVPDVLVLDPIVEVWSEVKKPANVVLVFDKSSSMRGTKIGQAINGAVEFVGEMGREDWLAWVSFNNEVFRGTRGVNSEVGEQLQIDIRSTTARGGTALFDAVANAYRMLKARESVHGDTARYGIVVLSDGHDKTSQTSLAMLEDMLTPAESEVAGIQIHTMGVGDDADNPTLTKIANVSHGRYWKVKDPATLEAVYRRISKYW